MNVVKRLLLISVCTVVVPPAVADASGTARFVGRAPAAYVVARVGLKIGGSGRYAKAAYNANRERMAAGKHMAKLMSAKASKALRRLARRSRGGLRLASFERKFELADPDSDIYARFRPVVEEADAAAFIKKRNRPCYYKIEDGYILLVPVRRLPGKAMRQRLTKMAKALFVRVPFVHSLRKSDAEGAAEMIYGEGSGGFVRNLRLLPRKRAATVRVLLLHLAVAANNQQVIRLLLKRRVNVNARNSVRYKETPLHRAVDKGVLPLVRLLVAKGARVNATNEFDKTPLHDAIRAGRLPIVRYLIGKGANVNYMSQEYWSPLHAAAARGDLAIVQALLAAKANPAARGSDKRTPADVAKNPAIKKLLGGK